LAAKKRKNKKWLGLLVLIAVLVIGGALYIKLHQRSTSKTPAADPKQYAQTQGSQSSGATSTSTTGSGGGSSTGSSSTSLPAPSGQLLNKQTISLSSTDPQTGPALESVCQTLANAQCNIVLTGPSGQSLSVGNHATGGNGTVIIDWNAKTVGLSTGKWTVQAVVSQNGSTGTSHSEYLQVNS
jgi:cytoskeletal protein RodZ